MKTTVAEAHAFHVIPPDQMAKISAMSFAVTRD